MDGYRFFNLVVGHSSYAWSSYSDGVCKSSEQWHPHSPMRGEARDGSARSACDGIEPPSGPSTRVRTCHPLPIPSNPIHPHQSRCLFFGGRLHQVSLVLDTR